MKSRDKSNRQLGRGGLLIFIYVIYSDYVLCFPISYLFITSILCIKLFKVCFQVAVISISKSGIYVKLTLEFLFCAALCYSTSETKSTFSPSVIVIGAGFAGVAAARALHDASFEVIMLESRDRIGGRVHTDYSFGFPVDLGASW